MDLADVEDVSIFSEQLGSRFRIEIAPDQIADATLVEAESLKGPDEPSSPHNRIGFSLLFDVDQEIPQNTYKVEHDKLGELLLFMSPVGPRMMESIFN